MTELYHVVVQRRGIAAALQLNYHSKDDANEAFLALIEPSTNGATGFQRTVVMDNYGSTIAFDPNDIGHVMLVSAAGSLEMQAIYAVMNARAQAEAQAQAQRDPKITRGGLVIPVMPGEMPQH